MRREAQPDVVPDVIADVTWGAKDVAVGVVVSVAIFFAIVFAILTPFAIADQDVSDNTSLNLVLNASLYVPLLLVPWYIARRRSRDPGHALGFRDLPWNVTWRVPVGLFSVYGVLIVSLVIITALGFDSEGNVPDDIFTDNQTVALAFLVIGLIAPFVEETFFRGFVFAGLAKSFGLPVAFAVSGLLFGAAHFDLTLLVPFALVGMVLAWTYIRSGSLWANIMVHAAFNMVSLAIGVATR